MFSRVALPKEVQLHSPSQSEEDTEEEYTSPPQKKSDLITLTVPRKRLLTGTAELATRCRVSNRTATAVVANFVKMGGGKLKDCTLSASSSYRHRKSQIKQSAEQIKQDFKTNMPEFLILHWDS